jgi:hypothetical protein
MEVPTGLPNREFHNSNQTRESCLESAEEDLKGDAPRVEIVGQSLGQALVKLGLRFETFLLTSISLRPKTTVLDRQPLAAECRERRGAGADIGLRSSGELFLPVSHLQGFRLLLDRSL